MVKRLIISRNAYLHIDRIVEFNNVRNHSDNYSRKFVKALFKQLQLLKKFPVMGIKTNQEDVFLLIWSDYYIYYSIIETAVEIRTIYHQKENVR
jgi:plasmid stabilization system protein ParE